MARPASYEPAFVLPAHGPGDTVAGELRALRDVPDLRRMDLELRYDDRSASYASGQVVATVEGVREGPVSSGDLIPFALTLPADAMPGWSRADTDELGTLGWSLVIQSDIAQGLDTTETHAIPLDPDPARWTGPALETIAPPAPKGAAGGWDVELTLDPPVVRRGETLTAHLRIGKPQAGRDIAFRFLCFADYALEEEYRDGDNDLRTRKSWHHEDMLRVEPPVDPSLAEQTFTLEIPPDAPFTWDGGAFGFRWLVVVEERRRWRSDPHTSLQAHVAP